ncbi:MAG: chromate transporter, partial [Symploca sp. SIO1C4]|nr:chromate transporter [Symploca sp. SIO1C4]
MHLQQQITSSPLRVLSIIFVKVGAMAFGGAVPAYLLHHLLKHQLLTEKEYLEALNWCQSLPGPNGTNLSAYLGWRCRGSWGSLLATLSLILPGAAWILLTSEFISSVHQQSLIQGALSGAAAAAVGLIVAMTWKLAQGLSTCTQLVAVAITFFLVGILRIPTRKKVIAT